MPVLERIAHWLEGLKPHVDGMPDLTVWAAPLAVNGSLQIRCNRGDPAQRLGGGVAIPCLAQLSWRELLRLRGAGVREVSIVHKAGDCQRCSGGLDGLPPFCVPVTICEAWTEQGLTDHLDADRRRFLLGLVGRAPEPPPESAEALLEAGAATLETAFSLPLPERVVGPGCTLCGACARVCPAYAVDGGRLTWQASRCLGCGQCERSCPAGVLKAGDPLSAGAFAAGARVLAEAPERLCSCGERYRNTDPAARCLRCELLSRRSDPDDSHPRFF